MRIMNYGTETADISSTCSILEVRDKIHTVIKHISDSLLLDSYMKICDMLVRETTISRFTLITRVQQPLMCLFDIFQILLCQTI